MNKKNKKHVELNVFIGRFVLENLHHIMQSFFFDLYVFYCSI